MNMYCFTLVSFMLSAAHASSMLANLTTNDHAGAMCLDCHRLRLFTRTGTSLENCSTSNPPLCDPSTSNSTHHQHSPSVTVVDCSKTDLPFCDPSTSSCSATPPPECVNPDNFTCISDGYFPDPWDCRSFYLCVDSAPTKYVCDSDTPSYDYFDVILHRCTSTAHCGYKCSGKSGVKMAHPDDPNLFAYCFNGTALLQDRCPGNYELNEATERCEAVCHTNGLLVDVEDCTRFYRCIYQNYGYYRSHEECPQGQQFNALTLQCEDNHTNCTATQQELIEEGTN